MKKIGFAAAVASGIGAALIGLTGPALAAPTGTGDALDTIARLQREGYTVVVNRIGNAPLQNASVVAIRDGQTFLRTDNGVAGANHPTTQVLNKTVYVDVK